MAPCYAGENVELRFEEPLQLLILFFLFFFFSFVHFLVLLPFHVYAIDIHITF